ncbi:hypothetical protein FIBSPDRAFT_879092 [Athelia psychrophila]|uniref:Uncharacterized protein n=1 Tax=Athelia psychrophila TaxID=1759441 RepID=A0A167UDM5_9AGAM|nr:hypothetical protein FIBSPDRAFT_879092 [Fibularhizoctonia sp. CBS 109695]
MHMSESRDFTGFSPMPFDAEIVSFGRSNELVSGSQGGGVRVKGGAVKLSRDVCKFVPSG